MLILSYSEEKIVEIIFDRDTRYERVLNISLLAKRIGVSQGLISKLLTKLHMAGFIEKKSMSRFGTYVRVIDKDLVKKSVGNHY